MVKKLNVFLFIFIFMFFLNPVFSAECEDGARLYEVLFSLNDDSFSYDYDGIAGIIQKIKLNTSSNLYSMWQTDKLSFITTYPWGGNSENFFVYSGNQIDFNIDSHFNSIKNRLLILNPSNSDNFNLYYKITLENTGTCHYNNHAWIGNYGTSSLKYYGVNDYNSYFKNNYANPSSSWEFKDTPQGGFKSQVFNIKIDNGIDYYGKLYTRIGPTASSAPNYQNVNAYFWINGSESICSDNIIGYGETCDDGNLINGDGCSNSCQIEVCDDVTRFEKVVFSLNDNTFSQDYDGNSGIIQVVEYNYSIDKYSLWQTPNLPYKTNTPDDSSLLYRKLTSQLPFDLDTNFNNNRNHVLILNGNDNDSNLRLYYNLTLKNIATCNSPPSYVGNYGNSGTFRYAGYNSFNSIYSLNVNPSGTETFSFSYKNETVSKVYSVEKDNIPYYGKLYFRVGPRAKIGWPYDPRNEINLFFWFNGNSTTCGDGIKEFGEYCDDGNLVNGDGCSISCQIEPPIVPDIKWENYKTSSELWQGRNLKVGDNITLDYSAYNPNPYDVTIEFASLLFNEPYNLYADSSWKRYFQISNLERVSNQQTHTLINIPANTKIYFNKTFYIPDFSEDKQNILERFYIFELFKFKKNSESGSPYFPKYSNGNDNIGWWRTDPNVLSYSSYKWSGWYSRGWGLGSYRPLYGIFDFKPNDLTLRLNVNNDGVPEIEINYDSGIVRSSYIKEIPKNTFYVNSKLFLESGTKIYENNFLIDEKFKRIDGNNIEPNQGYLPELEVKKRFFFSLPDFDLVNGKKVYFYSTLFLNETGQEIYMDGKNTKKSSSIVVDLESPIALSVDSPIILRPNGGGKKLDELYQRFLIFNYKDYSLLNIDLSIEFLDENENVLSDIYEVEYSNITIIPAGSAYPVGFKINLKNNPGNIDNHKILLKITYYDTELGEYVTKLRKTELKIDNTNVNELFPDLIPYSINFSLLNNGDESNFSVGIANQGNKNANAFNVSFYVKPVSGGDFTLFGSKRINHLNKQDFIFVDFNFTPNTLEKYIFKIIVDEENEIDEENNFIKNSEINNIMTSISVVRDIDVVLVNVEPDYENAFNGTIPFKVFAKNKIPGGGGIDFYELKLYFFGDNGYEFNTSHFFYQIPEEGYEYTFNISVVGVPAQAYEYQVELLTMLDPDTSDNFLYGLYFSFCPLPWIESPLSCHTLCTNSCTNKQNGRYSSGCYGVNGCYFKNQTLADNCDGFLEGYFPSYNETHELNCPLGDIIRKKKVTGDLILISGDCKDIKIENENVFYNGEIITLKKLFCIN